MQRAIAVFIRMKNGTGWRGWSAGMGSMCGMTLRGQCASG